MQICGGASHFPYQPQSWKMLALETDLRTHEEEGALETCLTPW